MRKNKPTDKATSANTVESPPHEGALVAELVGALRECADRLAIHIKHTEDLIAHMRAVKAINAADRAYSPPQLRERIE